MTRKRRTARSRNLIGRIRSVEYTKHFPTLGVTLLRQNILLNVTHVSITKNLYEALVHLRDAFSDSFLWIDALLHEDNNLGVRT
jgi:hypothetical protein